MKWLFELLSPARPPVISDAATRDASAIARLHAASFQRGWSEDEIEHMLLDRNVVAHRATIGKNFAGFIISRMAADEAEILSIAVSSSYRGRNIARTILRHHLGRLAAFGVRTVFLEVDEGNVSALRLYRRAGFVEVGRRDGYYPSTSGRPTSALVLRRDLA
ncbi:ribosomal protein S18-alanine N-acetyltransferase [Pseudorhodoplanes sinuspersici]|uniref:Ribosomal-protein-alanine N-acetyltransferase n=1 Tax=Pseudorhodoplanes sinuspersici TaxID=1235591 RepID=A0A1W6ZPC4_9HYPH|nr:ribosomal protein S18-alanine N-acetyltransferase [Pseudorhodoplanes sinuspersici]ARP99243.1 ribosomal-protein-alanine N-acetyltransferase [Pseudorhodoplanes sinuspersici]RKE69084.1 ribosomal-protein-alanine N-acetyltransferase [Pseudorhodoplanes sinuspersici]